MDRIDAEIMFPAVVAGPSTRLQTKAYGLQKSVIRSWNDWFAEEYLSASPAKGRIFDVGYIIEHITNFATSHLQTC